HQLARVDLLLILRRIEQRERRQLIAALAALDGRERLAVAERQRLRRRRRPLEDGRCAPGRGRHIFLVVFVVLVLVGRLGRRTAAEARLARLAAAGGGLTRLLFDLRGALRVGLLLVVVKDRLAYAAAAAFATPGQDPGAEAPFDAEALAERRGGLPEREARRVHDVEHGQREQQDG